MKEVLIDTSEDHVGIVIAEGLIIKSFTREFTKIFGKPVHMRELKFSEKFSIVRKFEQFFRERSYSRKEVELYSIEVTDAKFWTILIKAILNRKIESVNADYEVQQSLKRFVNVLLLRQLNFFLLKETLQFADIVAYGNSHQDLVKHIWKNVPVERGSM
jgi:hypothetical protein